MESREYANSLPRSASSAAKEEYSVPHDLAKVSPTVDEVGPNRNSLLHVYRFYNLLIILPHLKKDIPAETQPIYDAANECVALFEESLQLPKHQLTEAVSFQEEFFKWFTTELGIFAHKSVNLDTQLKPEPDARDLMMLRLGNLKNDLRLCMYSPPPLSGLLFSF